MRRRYIHQMIVAEIDTQPVLHRKSNTGYDLLGYPNPIIFNASAISKCGVI